MDTPAAGATTRPADTVEDPYIWHSTGAFGAQAVKAREPAPARDPDSIATVAEAARPNWRWGDFLIGLGFGAIAVTALSLVINFNRH